MLKKLLTASFLMLFSTIAMGFSAFDGPYAGVAVGGSFFSGREFTQFDHMVVPDQNNSFTVTSKHSFKKNATMGSLFLGYGGSGLLRDADSIYLGGELFVDCAQRRDNTSEAAMNRLTTIFNLNTQIRVKSFGYGIDFRPGIILCEDTLFNVRFGIGVNKLKHSVTARDAVQVGGGGGGGAAPLTTILDHSIALHKKRHSFRLGAGVEQRFFECFSYRVDYIHTYFGKRAAITSISGNAGPVLATNTATSVIKMSSNAVLFALAWYW